MNCQEVMELIQRHVDDDLNERETSLMQDHVGQCPDCKALLDRLVRLSEGLAQLPRVEPPYSLVDALLPNLDKYEAEALAEETATMPSNRRRAASRRRVWIARISSVTAVCVIVAIFAVNGSIFDQMGSRSKEQLASKQESANSEVFFAADASSGSAELRATDQFGHPPVEGSAQQKSPDASVSNKEGASGSKSNQGYEMDTGTDDGMGMNALGGRSAAPDGPSVMEFANASGEAISPDGAWRAVLVEGVLILYAAEDGQTAFRHDPSPGTISNLVWREDSGALDYTYTDEGGRSTAQSLLVPEMKISMR